MGTRADFYIGKGDQAEWLGSVAWDGYEWNDAPDCALMNATTPEEFRTAVETIKKERKDFTSPEQGWPWPWEDSNTTDYAYMLIDGKTVAYAFGCECFVNAQGEQDCSEDKVGDFPDMSARQNVTLGPRSGVMVIGA